MLNQLDPSHGQIQIDDAYSVLRDL